MGHNAVGVEDSDGYYRAPSTFLISSAGMLRAPTFAFLARTKASAEDVIIKPGYLRACRSRRPVSLEDVF